MGERENHVARASTTIEAGPDRVWQVITDPTSMTEFFFGARVVTDWVVGGPIVWHGVWQGTPYQDTGRVLEVEPGRRLVTTHFSPLTGQPDVPENYHTLSWTLEPEGTGTRLTLEQDNNASAEEAAHSTGMWETLVASVKEIAERESGGPVP